MNNILTSAVFLIFYTLGNSAYAQESLISNSGADNGNANTKFPDLPYLLSQLNQEQQVAENIELLEAQAFFSYQGNKWNPTDSSIYEYDTGLNKKSITKMKYIFPNWENSELETYIYVQDTLKKVEVSAATGNNWSLRVERTYIYENGKIKEEKHINQVPNVWSNKYTYAYNVSGQLENKIHSRSQDNGISWTPNTKTSYTYNPSGTKNEEITQQWDVNTNSFVNSSKTIYQYNLIGKIEQLIIQAFVSNAWVDFAQVKNLYNDQDQLWRSYTLTKNNGNWDSTYRQNIAYNANNNPILILMEQYANNSWNNYLKIHNYYSIMMGVKEELQKNVINAFPNPSTDEITFHYTISQTQKVDLSIFNPQGQLVQQLVKATQQPGEYILTWQGTNNSGNLAAPGMYIYRLTKGNIVESGKLILQR